MKLFIIALIYVFFLKVVRKYLYPEKEYKEFMEKYKETNKKFIDAVKKKDLDMMEKINKERIELMKTVYVSFWIKQIPYLAVVLGLFYIFTHFLIDDKYDMFELPFTIPILNLSVIKGKVYVFIFFALVSSLIISLFEYLFKFLKSKFYTV